jgi:hypothetical protein
MKYSLNITVSRTAYMQIVRIHHSFIALTIMAYPVEVLWNLNATLVKWGLCENLSH